MGESTVARTGRPPPGKARGRRAATACGAGAAAPELRGTGAPGAAQAWRHIISGHGGYLRAERGAASVGDDAGEGGHAGEAVRCMRGRPGS